MIANPRKRILGERQHSLRDCRDVDTYLLFAIPVSSQIPLPELPRLSDYRGSEPAVTIRQVDAGTIRPEAFETCHEWRTQQGRLICRCSRRDADYLLSFPRQADFHLDTDGTINCVPARGVSQDLLRHLLLNQVLPRYLAHTGELLLHASAVTLANGNTVAFLGGSGYGKSTLASYCHLQGAQMVDDDCILLRSTGQGQRITGGVPTLRLYPDSLRALGHDPAAFAPYADGTTKLQMCLTGGETSDSASPVLHALFLLGAPQEAPADNAVTIAPAGGQTAMMSLLRSTFSLNPSDRNTLARTFSRVAQTLAAGLPVYQLDFPREHTVLPRVLQALRTGSHT